MITHEILKILKSRFLILILLTTVLLNSILLIYHCKELSVLYADFSASTEQHLEKNSLYPDVINNILSQAQNNLKEFKILGFSVNDYNVKYQQYTISRYTEILANIKFSDTPISGWDIYFSYQTSNIFIFCLTLIYGIFIFTQDHISGTYPIIFSTKNGRSATALSKITVSIIFSLFTTILFISENLLIVDYFYNFSSPFVVLQNIELFYLCPYDVSVLQFFFISSFLKLLSSISLCFITEVLCVFLKNYVLIYISGFGYLCLNLLLYHLNYINPDNLLKTSNLFAVIDSSVYYERLRTINFFGTIIPLCKFIFYAYSISVLLLILFIGFKYSCFSHYIQKIKLFEKFLDHFKRRKEKILSEKKRPQKTFTFSIFFWELYKTIFQGKTIPILCLLTIIKIIVSANEYEPILSYADAVYQDYMTILAGEDSLEKREFVITERNSLDTIISSFSIIQSQYFKNQIDSETYRIKLNEYNVACNKSPILQKIESHIAYIDEVNTEGKTAWFVYDTGWIKLFFSSFDWILYATMILLTMGTFSTEHESNSSSGGFEKILRSTYNGRRKTFFQKFSSSVTLSLIVFVIYHLIDMFLLCTAFDLPLFNAPLPSIEAFRFAPTSISIFDFYLFFIITRMLATTLLAMLFCSFSELFTNIYAALAISTAFSILPKLISSLGFDFFKKIDYTLFMQATPVILSNTVCMFAAVVTIICVGLLLIAQRKWCN